MTEGRKVLPPGTPLAACRSGGGLSLPVWERPEFLPLPFAGAFDMRLTCAKDRMGKIY